MNQRFYRVLFWSLALSGLLLDQASKYRVFQWLYHDGWGGEKEIVPGVFRLVAQFTDWKDPGDRLLSPLRTWGGAVQPRVNPGALFSLAVNYAGLANAVFATVSAVVAVALVFWGIRWTKNRDPWLCVALGLILAGTTGNLYDRCVFGGVRDFLHFYWINWPVFNLADCFLVCGATLLMVRALWKAPSAEERRPQAR
jgi:signal peptidase II